MPKPTTLPRWADNLADPGDIVEPLTGKKDIGWQDAELPPHSYMNWLFNTIYLWTIYLDELTDEALTWTAHHIFQDAIVVTDVGSGVDATVTATGRNTNAGVLGNSGPNGGTAYGVKGVGANRTGVGNNGTAGIGGTGTAVGGIGLAGQGGAGVTNGQGGIGGVALGGAGAGTGAGGIGGVVTGGAGGAGGAGGKGLQVTAGLGTGSVYAAAIEAVHGDVNVLDGDASISGDLSAGFIASASSVNVASGDAILFGNDGAGSDGKLTLGSDIIIRSPGADVPNANNPANTGELCERNIPKAYLTVTLNGTAAPDYSASDERWNIASVSVSSNILTVSFDTPFTAGTQPTVVISQGDETTTTLYHVRVLSRTDASVTFKIRDNAGVQINPAADASGMSFGLAFFGTHT